MKAFVQRSLRLAAVLVLVLFTVSLADEGMWLLDQLKELDWKSLEKRGMKLSPREVYALKDAVVIIDGGTGEFVSPKGLVLTNHHVAFGALQRASTPEHNYIENGFLAKTMEEEIPIPGYEVLITQAFKDVTDEVKQVLKEGMSPVERFDALNRQMEKIREAAEKEPGIEARVVSMFNGVYYYLVTYKRYKDVRLVYAPPRSIGEYGGDIDNWMWPRHTGDFAFFRVYATKDGEPADYSKDNVPYQPKKYFPISNQGVKEGDFTFILGFPGRTYRYRTSYSVAYNQEINFPFQIELFSTAIKVLENESKKDPRIAIAVSGFMKGLNNVLKNNQGMLDGFRKLKLLDKKKAFEKEFVAFLNSNPELKKKYGDVLPQIARLYADLRTWGPQHQWLGAVRFASLPNLVYTAYRYAIEKEKPEDQREPGFTEKNIQRMKEQLTYRNKQYFKEVDRAMMKAFLEKMANLPPDYQPKFVKNIIDGKTGAEAKQRVDAYVDKLFDGTQFNDLLDAARLLDMSRKQIEALNDPLVKFAKVYYEEMKPVEEKNKEFGGKIEELRAKYMEALFAWKGKKLYPDANRTLRFTYGDVRGYVPRDAVIYLPKTKLAGVVEKHTGKDPFNAPQKLLDLEAQRDFGPYMDPELHDVPVNFLHTTDITGGNSGSPVLNGRGELIGVAFDGNYEAMTSDFQFDNAITRTISVDAQYLLFILDKFSNAQNILNELEIVE